MEPITSQNTGQTISVTFGPVCWSAVQFINTSIQSIIPLLLICKIAQYWSHM